MAEAMTSFGSWLRRRRKALDLTQDALAGLVGCSKDLIVKIEGDARRPSREIAALLATHLQLATEERDDFIRCARAELAADRLPSPTASVPLPAFARAATVAALPRHNLPLQLSSFLGREREIAELAALVGRPDRRLVTLTGAGGTGKTRLALQVAAATAPAFPDGAWFVDLAPISDPQQIAPTIMQALGIRELPNQTPQERLAQWLAPKQLLLVLDNFEQILDAAPLVVTLLQAAPQLAILVTSRVPLRLRGEQEYPVQPLGLPSISAQALKRSSAQALSADLTQYEAVRLFIERARAVRPEFQVTNTTAPAIAEICHRLDGLPLAIELAAARIRMFPPEQLLLRLRHDLLPTLSGGARDLPARQQTIQATIDWSYRLLTPAQQQLFARLGVFVGGWTLDAAESVGAEDGVDVATKLQALVEHSLVRVIETGNGPRYTMLETVREFAVDQLRLLDTTTLVRDRHAAFFAGLAVQLEPVLWTDQQESAFNRLSEEVDNIRAALGYTTTLRLSEEHTRIALSLATDLQLFWGGRTTHAEGLHWLKSALLSAQERLPALRARAQLAYGEIAGWSGLIDEAEQALQMGLGVSELAGSHGTAARILHALAELCYYRGAVHLGLEYAEHGLSIAEQINDIDACGWTMLDRARMRHLRGDVEEARADAQSAIALFERVGDVNGVYYSRLSYLENLIDSGMLPNDEELFCPIREFEHAEIAFLEAISWRIRGNFERARRFFEHELTRVRAAENPLNHAMISYELGITRLIEGDLSGARIILYQAMASTERISSRWIIAMIHHAAGIADYGCGYLAEARINLTRSLQIFHAMSHGTRAVDYGLAAVLDGLAMAAAAEALQRGASTTLLVAAARWWGKSAQLRTSYQLGSFPCSCVSSLPIDLDPTLQAQAAANVTLGDTAFATAWAAGQALTLDDAVAEALALSADPAPTE